MYVYVLIYNNKVYVLICHLFFQAYRAYKWATKVPSCASQILCTINEKNQPDDSNESRVRSGLLRAASFPAAWAVSNKLGINFWSLYGAIMEQSGCIVSKLQFKNN